MGFREGVRGSLVVTDEAAGSPGSQRGRGVYIQPLARQQRDSAPPAAASSEGTTVRFVWASAPVVVLTCMILPPPGPITRLAMFWGHEMTCETEARDYSGFGRGSFITDDWTTRAGRGRGGGEVSAVAGCIIGQNLQSEAPTFCTGAEGAPPD